MPSRRKKSRVLYSVHPGVAYSQAIVANLPARTGRSLEEWTDLLKREGPAGEKERRAWLKSEHGLGGTTAFTIAEFSVEKMLWGIDPDAYLEKAVEYVDAMYDGKKALLRPIHDRLIELALSIAPEIRICPCKTIVPLYREHVVAEIKPATLRRVDLGLALRGSKRKPPKRLLETGGEKKGNRITHRIPIASTEEVDDEVERWLRIAHELDA